MVEWVKELDDMGVDPKRCYVEEMMRAILMRHGSAKDITRVRVGKHLIQHFMNRHRVVSARFANTVNRKGAVSSDPRVVNYFSTGLAKHKVDTR